MKRWSTQTAAVNSQTPDAAAAFTNERNVGVLSVTKNAVGNAVKFEKNGRAVFSFSATLTYADWIDLTQTNNLPTVDGKTPKEHDRGCEEPYGDARSLSIPVTEAARVGSLTVEKHPQGHAVRGARVFDAQGQLLSHGFDAERPGERRRSDRNHRGCADRRRSLHSTRAMSARWKSPRSWRARAITTAWP